MIPRVIKVILTLLLLLIPHMVYAEGIALDLGESISGATTSRIFQIIILITILSLAPSILIMLTSFTRIVIVLSVLRTATGLQQTPPNTVLVSLALFLTFFIMSPVIEEAYDSGLKPLIQEEIDEMKALELVGIPFHSFMRENTRDKDISLFAEINKTELKEPENIPYAVLIPSFMISELKRAFEMGFLIFLPFLIIDMLVASVLMAMGMMMVPPVMIALPFKLIFFVLIDGWYMLCGSIIKSYGLG
jgi:flagellar biosynthetic protein FliP